MSQVRDAACPNEIVFYRHFQVNYLELSWTILHYLELSCTSRWTGRGPWWTRTDGTLSRWSSPARTCRRTTRLRWLIRNSALKTTHVMDFIQCIMKFWAKVFDGFHVIYDWISAGCSSHQPESERHWLLQLHCEEPVRWRCFYWMGSGDHCSFLTYVFE